MEFVRLPMDGCGLSRHAAISPAAIFCILLGISFVVADLYYYGVLGDLPCSVSNCSATIPKPSVKLMMQDHMCHYIHHYGAEAFEESTHLSELPFITPNFITTVHIFVGAFGGYLVVSDHLKVRQLSVLVFQIRIFLDMMDGVVFRHQQHRSMYVNGWGTMGYYIDAGADILASMFLVYGLVVYFCKHPPRRNEHLPVRHPTEPMADVPVSRSTIQLTLLLCFVQGCLRGMFWDRYQFAFHAVFNKVLHRKADALLQARIFNSPLTRFILWCWKLSSAEGMLGFVYLSVFLDFAWPFLVILRKYGFIQLGVVVLITQLHSWQVSEFLAKAA